MGLLTHLTWGDSWRRQKEGLGRVVDAIQAKSINMPKPIGPDDPSVDVYIYVSGAVWQHEDEGFKLGTLSARGRNWLRVMIYVPDHLTGQLESETYFSATLEDAAVAVEGRLRMKRPDWPIETLVEHVRLLKPAA
ncbi:hypothetical protein [Terrabacter terrigena]|uniref:Uncharacterized protein n=1 Tax=Terrabacter terrigena TaxID=574718 RepID=A0ABW3N360_9MICO